MLTLKACMLIVYLGPTNTLGEAKSKVNDLLVFGKAVNESLPSDFTAKGMSVPLSLCLFHGLHFLSFKPSQPSGTVSMEWEGRC